MLLGQSPAPTPAKNHHHKMKAMSVFFIVLLVLIAAFIIGSYTRSFYLKYRFEKLKEAAAKREVATNAREEETESGSVAF